MLILQMFLYFIHKHLITQVFLYRERKIKPSIARRCYTLFRKERGLK